MMCSLLLTPDFQILGLGEVAAAAVVSSSLYECDTAGSAMTLLREKRFSLSVTKSPP
jgi:hypothetical protein